MTEFGFPVAYHEEIIELAVPDLHKVVTTALEELEWNSAENDDQEFTQFFRPDHTWWKTRWKDGKVKVLGDDRVLVHIGKFAYGDMIDWGDECKKLVEQFRVKLAEVAARGTPFRGA